MEDGDVNQFLDNITFQEEAVVFEGKKYFFNPCGYRTHGQLEIQQWKLNNDWESDFYYVDAADVYECIRLMTKACMWNGKTFWEAESEMRWVEW